MSAAISVSIEGNHLEVSIDGKRKIVELWPQDDELVTFEFLAAQWFRGCRNVVVLQQKAKKAGYIAEDYPKKGKQVQIPFGIGKNIK